MKKLFSFIAFTLIISSHAQTLKDFSVPKGYKKISEAKGDLDKDGRDEIVMIFNTDIRASKEEYPEADYKRVLYILKNTVNGLKVWKEASGFLISSGMGFSPEYNGPPEISIKNNVLAIRQELNTNSRHTLAYRHTFRFQNNDFYLIGSQENFDDTCEFNILHEVNFSTGKAIVDEQYYPCFEGGKAPQENFYKAFTHKFKHLIRMTDFKTGENRFPVPGSKRSFIF
ncbi:hypothetical protein P2W68_14195 [Chryseobacterium arthrosphaerae]|uniref:hypothetical protein n=1 Tax=Chryseobacterium arthrosphaerae TaxID=651561 RepID=UPI0023E1EA2E|nr:hypothetical protein [Chryseobacterium arthrosphaerae]WES96002.1 hypothetical protein P2W68_14195 [Chryseobacterium arthrosphaerae]